MKRTVISALLFAVVAAGLFSLFNVKEETGSLFAFDTYVEFNIRGKGANVAKARAISELKRLHSELNVNGSGALSSYNSGGAMTDEIKELLKESKAVGDETGGALDVTLYPVTRLWGFTTDGKKVPADEEIKAALNKTGYDKSHPEIDLGAVAKGYAADNMKKILKEEKVKSAVFSIGGTVLVYGKEALVAVKDPEGEGYAATVKCRDRVLSTSGGYERYFTENGKSYSHIIDPATGYPAESGIVSATAVSESGFLSDSLSTAFFVMGEEKAKEYLKEHKEVGAVLITADGRMIVTENLKTESHDSKYTLEII